jgi:ketosteroid isomerase-like protein
MSQDNVEIVRKAVDALNRGDRESAMAWAHPDIEWQTLDVFPDAGTYRGPEGVQEFFDAWLDTFKGFQLHLDRCVAVSDRQVVAAVRVSGEGTESGARVESPTFFQLLEFGDGLLLRSRMFESESEALEAAGLRE